MINTVRKILLLVACGILGAAGFYFFKYLNTTVEMKNISVKVMEKGVDVEIQNFRVSHENKGFKEWELKADLAQINNQTNITNLQNVEMILHKANNNKYTISADKGTFQKNTKDVNLEGNVKLIGSDEILQERINTQYSPKKIDLAN